jgi:transglutaminase-like putative cysteine protease
MKYEVVHATRYDYSEPVSVSHHIARLVPRTDARQTCVHHELKITPTPEVTIDHVDYFGNAMTFFAMQSAHNQLTVRAESIVELGVPAPPAGWETIAWEQAADRASMPLEAVECVVDSMPLQLRSAFTAYTVSSFWPGRPLRDGLADLTARIHADFTYDRSATTVATPLAQVFESRRGVCQDFARLEIACLRSIGMAARYVSGYLETVPAPGEGRLVGADASHAWLAVYGPGIGWIDVDPTNNLFPSGQHVTVGWGRDYRDVSPIRGIILGGGEHSLHVNVDVTRVDGANQTEVSADEADRNSDRRR